MTKVDTDQLLEYRKLLVGGGTDCNIISAVGDVCDALGGLNFTAIKFDVGNVPAASKIYSYKGKYVKAAEDFDADLLELCNNIEKAADIIKTSNTQGTQFFEDSLYNGSDSTYGNAAGSASASAAVFAEYEEWLKKHGGNNNNKTTANPSSGKTTTDSSSGKSTSTETPPRVNSPYDAVDYYKKKAKETTGEESKRWKKRADDLEKRLKNY